ncbi:hypothetical protein KCU99_g3578, partial [Aureobasidium melanogenum]
MSALSALRPTRSERRGSRRLTIPYEQMRNDSVVCAPCWLNGRPCDHKLPCSPCKAAGAERLCFYIRCPLRACPIAPRCPAYHAPKTNSHEDKLASPLHLIALTKLPLRGFPSDSFDHFQRIHDDPTSAQWLFNLIHDRLQENKSEINGDIIKSYILQSLNPGHSSSQLNKEKLNSRVRLIAEFIPEKYNSPFKAIWDRYEKRIGRFANGNV